MAYQNVNFCVTNEILLLHNHRYLLHKRNTSHIQKHQTRTGKQKALDNAVVCKVEITTVFEKETEAQHLTLAKKMYRRHIEKMGQ